MRAKVRLFGHPVHQMLVVFPLGLLAGSMITDMLAIALGSTLTALMSYGLIAGGLIGAAIAIPFGIADYIAIPRHTRAKRIGMLHGGGNILVSALFLLSWFLREPGLMPGSVALAFSFSAIAIALLTAWLGAEMVVRHAVGVDDDAGINAPPRRGVLLASGARRRR